MDDRTKRIVRAIFGLKSPPPAGSQHYRSGWDDGLEAAIDAAQNAVPDSDGRPTDAERAAAVADILRHTADLVDQADLPQTSEDTSVFHDGARWATAEVRRIADAVTSEDPEWRPDGLAELAQGFGLTDAERAMLRYALEVIEDKMASECDEFTDDEDAAVTSLKRLAGEGS